MESLSRALGRTLAVLAVVTTCCTGGPDDPDTALDGRGASEGGGGASEGGRAETTGGRRAQSNGGSRPAGDGGSSGAHEAGGESGSVGGSPGDDPSAGASGDVDASGGNTSGGNTSGGNTSGGNTSGGGSSTGGGIPSGGFPSVDGCSTGRFWDPAGSDGLAAEGPWMNPGRMCQTCHREETGGDVVEIGGTVYPSLDEQDLCYGVDGTSINAEVVVTDNEGEVFRLPVGPTGNFSLLLEGARKVQLPISAKVVVGDRERVMTYHPNVADCNYCHTREGLNGAPGRIFLP